MFMCWGGSLADITFEWTHLCLIEVFLSQLCFVLFFFVLFCLCVEGLTNFEISSFCENILEDLRRIFIHNIIYNSILDILWSQCYMLEVSSKVLPIRKTHKRRNYLGGSLIYNIWMDASLPHRNVSFTALFCFVLFCLVLFMCWGGSLADITFEWTHLCLIEVFLSQLCFVLFFSFLFCVCAEGAVWYITFE